MSTAATLAAALHTATEATQELLDEHPLTNSQRAVIKAAMPHLQTAQLMLDAVCIKLMPQASACDQCGGRGRYRLPYRHDYADCDLCDAARTSAPISQASATTSDGAGASESKA